MLIAFFVLVCILIIVTSFLFSEPLKTKANDLSGKVGGRAQWRGLGNYPILAVLFACWRAYTFGFDQSVVRGCVCESC